MLCRSGGGGIRTGKALASNAASQSGLSLSLATVDAESSRNRSRLGGVRTSPRQRRSFPRSPDGVLRDKLGDKTKV